MKPKRTNPWRLLMPLALIAAAATPAFCAGAPTAAGLVAEGNALYDKADYGKALLKYEEAVKQGAEGGELFYRMGFCYRMVRDDVASSRAHYARALPLLETDLRVAKTPSLSTYYYIATITAGEIPDPDRLAEVAGQAGKGLASATIPKPTDGEGMFQAGRLYDLAGRRDEAADWYGKAIDRFDKDGVAASSPAYALALKAAADNALSKQDAAKSADLLGRMLKADASREDLRAPLALSLFRAGREEEAIEVLNASRDPRGAEERVYFVRVARRYAALGRPKVEAPEADEELVKAIVDAARAYGQIRAKDDEVAKKLSDEWTEEKLAEMKARRKAGKSGKAPAGGDIDEIPPEKRTVEQQLAAMGIRNVIPAPPPPPESPDRIEAERKFFGLMAEMVRRGRPLRDFALTNGLAPVIFR